MAGIRRAADRVRLPVTTVVVLDSCTDDSARSAATADQVLEVDCRNVGAARAAGFAASGESGRADVWFATTDADSVVPETWLVDQLAYWADHDAVVGTVRVDWRTGTAGTRRRYDEAYRLRRGAVHGHVHGANLGLRADLYRDVGGFHPHALAEDVDLVRRLGDAGARIAWDEHNAVVTSDRRRPRARGGFGDFLSTLDRLETRGPVRADVQELR
ncbi:glycosyltransferase [Rhodococcus sp. SGAir0479]|uniref:glycosyltransferase n=1 Tax=Rhodococcus sp. SGAir0479 TaxID=2567884 RepID=UPI0010CD3EBF|nr:glycosyltransferase family 2 protein [Rhodococcus sp. SGAir0479]